MGNKQKYNFNSEIEIGGTFFIEENYYFKSFVQITGNSYVIIIIINYLIKLIQSIHGNEDDSFGIYN